MPNLNSISFPYKLLFVTLFSFMLCLQAINYLKCKIRKFRESKQGQPTKPRKNMEVEEEDSDSDSYKSFAENDEEWNPERDEDEFEDREE